MLINANPLPSRTGTQQWETSRRFFFFRTLPAGSGNKRARNARGKAYGLRAGRAAGSQILRISSNRPTDCAREQGKALRPYGGRKNERNAPPGSGQKSPAKSAAGGASGRVRAGRAADRRKSGISFPLLRHAPGGETASAAFPDTVCNKKDGSSLSV